MTPYYRLPRTEDAEDASTILIAALLAMLACSFYALI